MYYKFKVKKFQEEIIIKENNSKHNIIILPYYALTPL